VRKKIEVEVVKIEPPRVAICNMECRPPFDTGSWKFGFFATLAADDSRAIPEIRFQTANFLLIRPKDKGREAAITELVKQAQLSRYCKLEIFYESRPITMEEWNLVKAFNARVCANVEPNREMAHSA